MDKSGQGVPFGQRNQRQNRKDIKETCFFVCVLTKHEKEMVSYRMIYRRERGRKKVNCVIYIGPLVKDNHSSLTGVKNGDV